MAKTKEQIIKEIMKDCECSREDAEYVYNLEQAEKENGKTERHYNKSSGKERKPVERKPNEDKRKLIATLETSVHDLGAQITNPERQIDFIYNGVEYSVTLTAHRAKKEG